MGKYPDFVKTTGYKKPGGLCGFNCRHSFHPIDPEIDKPTYSKEELQEMQDEKVTLPNGEQVHTYTAMRYQRAMERGVRRTKQALEMAKSGDAEELQKELSALVHKQQKQLVKFCNSTGLPRIYSRESIWG